MSAKHLPKKITPDVTLVACKVSKDGKSFIPIHTPLKIAELEDLKKQPWTEEEDEFLKDFAMRCKKWTLLAKEINNEFHNNVLIRNQKQCRERWKNFLDPELKKKPFSKSEDDLIVKLYEKHKSWAKVAKELKNRNENQVKNRYRALKDRKKNKDVKNLQFFVDVSAQYEHVRNFPHLESIPSLPSLPSHLSYLSSVNSKLMPNIPLDQAITPLSSEYPSFSIQPDHNEMFTASFNTNIVSPAVSHTFCHDSKNGIFFAAYGEPFNYSKCDMLLDNFCDQNYNGNS